MTDGELLVAIEAIARLTTEKGSWGHADGMAAVRDMQQILRIAMKRDALDERAQMNARALAELDEPGALPTMIAHDPPPWDEASTKTQRDLLLVALTEVLAALGAIETPANGAQIIDAAQVWLGNEPRTWDEWLDFAARRWVADTTPDPMAEHRARPFEDQALRLALDAIADLNRDR
jgi:hypothetical protein